jgi:hypothetical protein
MVLGSCVSGCGDDPVPAAAGAAGFRLHGDLGRPRALAGLHGHHGDDVRGWPGRGQGAAQYLIIAGAVLIGISMYGMTNVYGDLGFWFMARNVKLGGSVSMGH